MKEGPFQIAPPQRSAIKQRRGKSQVARFSFSPSAAIRTRARSQSVPKCVRGANKVQGVCVLCGREERRTAAQRFASGNRLDPRSDSTVREEAEDRVCRVTSTENEAMLCCMWARKLRRTSVQVHEQLILNRGLLSWVGMRFGEAGA